MIKFILFFLTSCSLALKEENKIAVNSEGDTSPLLGEPTIKLANMLTLGSSDEGRRNFSVKNCPDLIANDLVCTNCEILSINSYGNEEYNVEVLPFYTGELVKLEFHEDSLCIGDTSASFKFKDRSNSLSSTVFEEDRIAVKTLNENDYTDVNARVYFHANLTFDYTPHEGTELEVRFGTCGVEGDSNEERYHVLFDLYEFVKNKTTNILPVKEIYVGENSPFDFTNSLKSYNSGLFHWDKNENKLSFLIDKYKIAQETNRIFQQTYADDNEKPLNYCLLVDYKENNTVISTTKFQLRKVLNLIGVEMINFNNHDSCEDHYFVSLVTTTDESTYPHSYCTKNNQLHLNEDQDFLTKYTAWTLTYPQTSLEFDLNFKNNIDDWYSYYYGDFFSTIPVDLVEFFTAGSLTSCDPWTTNYLNTDQINFTQFQARFIKKHFNDGYLNEYHHDNTYLTGNFLPNGVNENIYCKSSSYLNHVDYGEMKSSFIKAQVAYKNSFAEVTASHHKTQTVMTSLSSLKNNLMFYPGSGELVLFTKVDVPKIKNYTSDDVDYSEDLFTYGSAFMEAASVAARNTPKQNYYNIDLDKMESSSLLNDYNFLLVSAAIIEHENTCDPFTAETPYTDNCLPYTHSLMKTSYSVYDVNDLGNEKPYAPSIELPKSYFLKVKNDQVIKKNIFNYPFIAHSVVLSEINKKYQTVFDLSDHENFQKKTILIHTNLPMWIRGLLWWWHDDETPSNNFENLGPVFPSEDSSLGVPMLYRPIMMPLSNYGSVMVDYAY